MKNKSNLIVQHILSTCDITVSAIKHNQNISADLTGTHVDTSAEFLFDESLCALNDPCNTSNNKQTTPYPFGYLCLFVYKNISS